MKEINNLDNSLRAGWSWNEEIKIWVNRKGRRFWNPKDLQLTELSVNLLLWAKKNRWYWDEDRKFWKKSYQDPKSTKELFDLYNRPFKVLGKVKSITEEPELNGQTITLTNYREKFFNRSCVIEEGTPYILTVDRNNCIINVNKIK